MMLKLLLTVTVGVVCVQGLHGVKQEPVEIRGHARVNPKNGWLPTKVPKTWVEENYKYNLKQTVVSFLPSNKHNGKGDRTSQATVHYHYTEKAEDGSITRKYVLNLGTEGLATVTVNEDWIAKYNEGDIVIIKDRRRYRNNEGDIVSGKKFKVTVNKIWAPKNKDVFQYNVSFLRRDVIEHQIPFPKLEIAENHIVRRATANDWIRDAKYKVNDIVKSYRTEETGEKRGEFRATVRDITWVPIGKKGILQYSLRFHSDLEIESVPENWIIRLSRKTEQPAGASASAAAAVYGGR